jgi:membrane protein implicated in regulation of membrane protease activity
MKRSDLKVGLRVILKKDTLDLGISEFIGREFVIDDVERAGYAGKLTVAIEGPRWAWCSHRDLKLVKEEAPKRGEW